MNTTTKIVLMLLIVGGLFVCAFSGAMAITAQNPSGKPTTIKVDTIKADTMNLVILGTPIKGDSLLLLREVRKNLETIRTNVKDLYNGYVKDRRTIDSLQITLDSLKIELRKCNPNTIGW